MRVISKRQQRDKLRACSSENLQQAGDEERKEAAEDLLVPLKSLYAQVRGKKYRVPSSGSIKLDVGVAGTAPGWRSLPSFRGLQKQP